MPGSALKIGLWALACVALWSSWPARALAAQAEKAQTPARKTPAAAPRAAAVRDGEAEARLIEIYRLIGRSANREALKQAEGLVKDHPNFQLAQLVYGDLLAGQMRPVKTLGDVPEGEAKAAAPVLADLRKESQQRLRALRERPAPGLVPSQFLALSPQNKHAIAVDASKSRLYLFENTATGLKLVADYYISVGKLGTEKAVEGDQRTPLGVYFITSNLNPRSLKDFYGAGALPINYPNQLDLKRGKTGSGIWLHGTPPEQFSRAPQASDGCVVLANPDLERIIRTVEVRSTPVVISQSLKWVPPQSLKAEVQSFEEALKGWHTTKSSGDIRKLTAWYTPDFTSYGKTFAQWTPTLQSELKQVGNRGTQIKDVSYLRWTDTADTMVVTFGEVAKGARTGLTKRQYWVRQGTQWKIFFEGTL
ncbi:L,D-transpeptidase [Polaromonas sp. YR568]|uniref:L,D-transpeptidase family protein n=1 Tax=Polaromonas sp. YR568 TaxID=1855301 RepID=UPI0031378292